MSDDKFAFGVNVFGPSGYFGTQLIIDKNSLIQDASPLAYYSPVYPNYYTIYPISSFNRNCMDMEANDWSPNTNRAYADNIILFNICGNPSSNNVSIDASPVPILRSYIPVLLISLITLKVKQTS